MNFTRMMEIDVYREDCRGDSTSNNSKSLLEYLRARFFSSKTYESHRVVLSFLRLSSRRSPLTESFSNIYKMKYSLRGCTLVRESARIFVAENFSGSFLDTMNNRLLIIGKQTVEAPNTSSEPV